MIHKGKLIATHTVQDRRASPEKAIELWKKSSEDNRGKLPEDRF